MTSMGADRRHHRGDGAGPDLAPLGAAAQDREHLGDPVVGQAGAGRVDAVITERLGDDAPHDLPGRASLPGTGLPEQREQVAADAAGVG